MGTTYGTGDGSTTFNVPNLVDKFIEGAATSGTVKAAGLPNITGYFGFRKYSTDGRPIMYNNSGAFYKGDDINNPSGTMAAATGTFKLDNLSFDASHSSSIYGNSTTVQPPALTMRYAIYTGNVGKYCWLRTV